MTGETPSSYWETPFAQPYFDNTTKREITATVGQSALLNCRVRNLGDRAVSIRDRLFVTYYFVVGSRVFDERTIKKF